MLLNYVRFAQMQGRAQHPHLIVFAEALPDVAMWNIYF
jgi:hypothetical protein